MKRRKNMSLYVHQAGRADAASIVFLHGLGLSGAMWQPQVERLPDYHCLAPDLPEHGKSADLGPLTLKDASRQVADVIGNYTPNGRAHVVGLSLGGAVAVRMLLDGPEVLEHVMISGTAARLDPLLASFNTMMGFLHPDQLAQLIFLQSSIPQDYRPLVLEGVQTVKPAAFHHFSQEVTQIELPHQVHVPLLITVGQNETFVVQQAAHEMTRAIQGAKGVMVQSVGHIWNLEAPDLFSETVRSWVTDTQLPQACRAF
jgi:pimeloyl-ACP methyl ester carboxylesterase